MISYTNTHLMLVISVQLICNQSEDRSKNNSSQNRCSCFTPGFDSRKAVTESLIPHILNIFSSPLSGIKRKDDIH